MKAIKTALSACALFSAAFAGYAGQKASDFKVKLVGVSIERADADDFSAKSLPPDKRIVVTPGNLAVFRLEYDFPAGVKSRLFLGPNFDESKLGGDPFGTSASGLLSGKGSVDKVIILGAGGSEPYEQELLLKSVRISGEIESKKGAPRNGSFFICDAPVNVLFANKGDADGSKAKVLDPRPSPAPDTSLGVVASDKPGKPRSSTPVGFTDDLDAAFAKAKAEGKFVYACFSGSDWCGWCMKLEREVFSKPEFISGVKDDYVLVFIDLPEDKSLLSEHAKSANPALVEKYNVHGFPTVLIMDADGTVLDKTGYRRGGPEEYLKNLAEIKKSSARLIALKRDIAGKAKGDPARLAKIDAAFADAGEETLKKNSALIQELLDNDPDGKYAAKYPFVKYRMPLDKNLSAVFADLNSRFRKRMREVAGKDKRPSREQMEQVRSEIDVYAVESLRKLLTETTKEQAAAPEYAKKEYEDFTKKIKSLIKNLESRDK